MIEIPAINDADQWGEKGGSRLRSVIDIAPITAEMVQEECAYANA